MVTSACTARPPSRRRAGCGARRAGEAMGVRSKVESGPMPDSGHRVISSGHFRLSTCPPIAGHLKSCTMTEVIDDNRFDLAVIGAGAAGLMAAIFAGRAGARVIALDGAKRIGAKILISGGGRCNVTHDVVTPEDFNGNRN